MLYAYLFAKENHDVTVYENHSQIGAPIQCTGILTNSFDQFNFPKESFLVNTITKIEVNSPNNKLTINQKDYIVCRTKFDQFFAKLAEEAGATILLNHSFTRKENNSLVIKNKDKELTITPDIVIAADGPLSPTAKAYNLYYKERKNYYGIKAIVDRNFSSHVVQTNFGNDVCPGLFIWIVPESSTTARVGLATMKNPRHYLNKFMKEHNFTAKHIQAGTIPLYSPKQQLHKDNCYVLGDASSYVKATTLGGIVPAMQQAEIVVDCTLNNKQLKKYIKPVKKQMWAHLQAQKIMAKFSDKDWDKLLHLVSQPKIQKVFERYTRDNPIPLLTNTIIKEPRFLQFTKYLF